MRPNRPLQRPGLKAIELIVVAVLLLVVLGVFFSWLPRGRESSKRLQCADYLKKIGEGIYHFHEIKGFLPASRIDAAYATWAVQIGPFLPLGQNNPFADWVLQKAYYDQPEALRQLQVHLFYCPSRRNPPQLSVAGEVPQDGKPNGGLFPGALGDYACSVGDGSPEATWDTAQANGALILGEVLERKDGLILRWRGRTTLTAVEQGDKTVLRVQLGEGPAKPVPLPRGTSQTILIGEKHVPLDQFGQVAVGDGSLYNGDYPASHARVGGRGFRIAQRPTDPFQRNFGSAHPTVCQFLMADGSVRPIT